MSRPSWTLEKKVFAYLCREIISLADILPSICEIQRVKNEDKVNTRISVRISLCLLYVKFHELKLKHLTNQ